MHDDEKVAPWERGNHHPEDAQFVFTARIYIYPGMNPSFRSFEQLLTIIRDTMIYQEEINDIIDNGAPVGIDEVNDIEGLYYEWWIQETKHPAE